LKQHGPVHLAYNPPYSACFFSRTVFFSHKKSATSIFQPAYNSSQQCLKQHAAMEFHAENVTKRPNCNSLITNGSSA
jgi:hypothetical protein